MSNEKSVHQRLSPMSASAKSTNRLILVVEDNDLNRELLVDYLEILGYDSKSAENGQVALNLIAEQLPDAILLDIDMPVMNGLEVLAHLAADEELRHIPVIMVSGRDDQENVVSAIGKGAVDFLGKPFNPTILNARLTSSLEKKDLRDRERALTRSLEQSLSDLKKAEASRDALTHMIVHDLGNPLAVIKMNTDMLKMGASMGMAVTEEALAERLTHITSASASMGTMIQSMLDVSKMESGQLVINTEHIDLGTFMNELSDRYAVAAQEVGITISVQVDTKEPLQSDRTLLDRMISNLVSNAFKYATGATRLALRVTPAGENVEIRVEDDGEGIPEELHGRVFDKFYQLESTSTGVKAGVGLGLAFCRMASEALGGSIRVENAEPTGTRFVITMPGRS